MPGLILKAELVKNNELVVDLGTQQKENERDIPAISRVDESSTQKAKATAA